jgi:aldose 1-epimerase
MKRFQNFARLLAAPLLLACAGSIVAAGEPTIARRPFGKTADGTEVDLYTLTNSLGMQASITNYGGIVVTLKVPDRDGNLGDVVLGYDTLDEYLAGSPYFGALIGRYGNRIAKGRFTLDGQQYVLARNNNENHLHGGIKGFDKVVWDARGMIDDRGLTLVLDYTSADGEEGYPGKLSVTVTYILPADENLLRIQYRAATDKPTVVNLTNHSYFNLAGQGEGDVLAHELRINADRFTPVDEGLIPTGELRPVAGTPFDFNEPTAIGKRIGAEDEQLKFGGGYDHNWVLNRSDRPLTLAATVYEPTSGRLMQVLTSEPGIQFYSGNFLDGSNVGKGGKVYQHRYGFCLETQHFPDSPNKPEFPSVVLKPGQEYSSVTVYRFSTR